MLDGHEICDHYVFVEYKKQPFQSKQLVAVLLELYWVSWNRYL
jgi:hypothetical protein